MNFIILLEILIFCLVVAYLLYKHADEDCPPYLLFFVYVCWLLCFSLVIILPLDIYYSMEVNNSHQQAFEYMWRILYWGVYLLTWIILPFIQEYELAGDFNHPDKVQRAIKNNLIFYLALMVPSMMILIYLMIYYGVSAQIVFQLSRDSLFSISASLVNCYGIVLIIVLLGYGLIAIPRMLFRGGDLETQQKYLQYQSVGLEQEKTKTHQDVCELVQVCYISQMRLRKSGDLTKAMLLDKVMDKCPKELIQNCTKNLSDDLYSDYIKKILDERQINMMNEIENTFDFSILIDIRKKLKYSIAACKRAEIQWEKHLEKAFLMEDIINSKHSQDYKIRSTFWQERTDFVGNYLDKLTWFWHVHAKQVTLKLLAVITSLLGFFVFIGEITIFTSFDFSVYSWFLKMGNSFSHVQIFTLVPLLFMAYVLNYGFFKLRITGMYSLNTPRQTDGPSLIFASINFSRVTYPLCFNYLQMVKIDNTAYNHVMGQINIVPLFGLNFSTIFPSMLFFLVLINYYDLWTKILDLAGWEQFSFDPGFKSNLVDEGIDILKIARESKEKDFIQESMSDMKQRGYTRSNRLQKGKHGLLIEDFQYQEIKRKYSRASVNEYVPPV